MAWEVKYPAILAMVKFCILWSSTSVHNWLVLLSHRDFMQLNGTNSICV